MEARHELDCFGNHRVVVDGEAGNPASYDNVAVLKKGDETFIAVTGNYEGILPVEQVFKLEPVKTTNAEPDVCNLYNRGMMCGMHKVKGKKS